MKKLLLIVAFATLALNMALSGQSITVVSPTGANPWCIGNEYVISWDRVGAMQDNVFINLKREGDTASGIPPVLEITTSTANPVGHNGYSWTIPNSVAPGMYFIRVRTLDTTVYGDSAVFEIKNCIIDWGHRFHDYRVEVKFPPGPDPCICPEWNIRELLERIREVNPKFAGRLGLLRDGVQILDLGAFDGGKTLPDTMKPTLTRKNFNAFKNGTAKFTLGIFNAKGKLVQQIEFQPAQQGAAPELR